MKQELKEDRKETYLTIHIVGHTPIKVWKNNERKNERHPQYKAEGVAVWVNVRNIPQPKPVEECIDEADYDGLI